jgi:hypothetical protein
MKDPYTENYKSLRKEIEECRKRWIGIRCSLIGKINIMEMVISQRVINRLNTILIKVD